jgi:hypothetical protein
MIRSSKAAVDLIVAEEVTSQSYYVTHYQHPEWPGGASGVTVGIGYDLGFSSPEKILEDWRNYLTPNVIQAMQGVSGLTGQSAKQALSRCRAQIVVPWDAAMAVFMNHDMPKWEALVLKAIPGSDKLPAGCFGVVTSIAYNRGASFSKDGDRYREMRDMRTHIMAGEFDEVPADIRSMKRLWPGVAGLIGRREREAVLWERSLAASPNSLQNEASVRVDTGDDKSIEVTPAGNQDTLNVQAPTGKYDPVVEAIQKQLTLMHYFEVGTIDGKSGGKLKGAIAAFMNDRGKPALGEITPGFKAELSDALAEGWSRPIAPDRANATAKDIAGKVGSVNQLWYQKLFAFVLGIPAAVTAGLKGIFGDQGGPSGYFTAVKDFFGAIPQEFYWLAIAALAVAVFVQAKKAQDTTVKAYQRGEIN